MEIKKKNIWKILFKAYDCGLLDSIVNTFVKSSKNAMLAVKTIMLPTDKYRDAHLRSSFIYGKHRRHIKIHTHRRVLYVDLGTRSPSVINEVFGNIHVPDSVNLTIKPETKGEKRKEQLNGQTKK